VAPWKREVTAVDEGLSSRGFRGRRPAPDLGGRLPPGQYVEQGFPVLTAGPTPRVASDRWDFRVVDETGSELGRWSWTEFAALPHEDVRCDIHCVTRWSKFDTRWRGVSVDRLLAGADPARTPYVVAFCDGGYTTNMPVAAVLGGRAWVVDEYEGRPLPPEHGGPARLLVPALYFWKSAKWVRGLRLHAEDAPGFWEVRGYHNQGDPWREERFSDG
jgi:DMSO/TMAO reductase YedYZ molybdopterin-dependent catalytic subunit